MVKRWLITWPTMAPNLFFRRDEKKKRPAAKRRPATLLPVVVRAEAIRETSWPSEPIAIAVCSDVAFRVPVGTDIDYVAALIAAVRKTC